MNPEERKFVGTWEQEINKSANGSPNFYRLQLDENRTGLKGIYSGIEGYDISIPSPISQKINNWKLKDDTLVVNYTIKGGTFSSPGRKDTTIDDFDKNEYLIIKELGMNYFTAELYHPEIPFKSMQRYERIKK